MNFAILGAGAWGTALGISLSARHGVALWARDAVQRSEIDRTRENRRYLAGCALPESVRLPTDPAEALAGAQAAILAVPTGALRATLAHLAGSGLPAILACKGFEPETALLPHQVVESVLPGATAAVLSGPSFALEVARALPAAVTLACAEQAEARRLAQVLHGKRLRVYSSGDVIGVEVAGAAKNVIAIAAGICDGLSLGLNARAALITRGLAEITRLGVALGGRVETFLGLAGAGDLILTCTGDLSRNRTVGKALAGGRPLSEVLATLGHVAEGVHSAREIDRVARQRGVEMPITAAVCGVLDGALSATEAVAGLLDRDPRAEF